MIRIVDIVQGVARQQPMSVLQNGQIVPSDMIWNVRPSAPPVSIHSVKPHRFHGDSLIDIDVPNPAPVVESPWWERSPAVFEQEKLAFADAFPRFQPETTTDGRFAWRGQMTNNMSRVHDIKIIYPPDYDRSHYSPEVFVVKGVPGRRKHIYRRGNLCLYNLKDRSWDEADTAITLVGWTAEWLFAQHYFELFKKWPFPAVDEPTR